MVRLVLLACVVSMSCKSSPTTMQAAEPSPAKIPEPYKPVRVIEDKSEVAAAVGQLVTLIGTQTRTKIPAVLGVDVDGDYAMSDKKVRVTGILERTEVAEHELPTPGGPQWAHRGAGAFYRIVDPQTGKLARPSPYHHQ